MQRSISSAVWTISFMWLCRPALKPISLAASPIRLKQSHMALKPGSVRLLRLGGKTTRWWASKSLRKVMAGFGGGGASFGGAGGGGVAGRGGDGGGGGGALRPRC